ncbi:heavy-metal-associated domain-containing protein [Ginsengibacter hankyongi]|uniref:Heavy-metal-associated domain-containing protein n=1 Tax=Ginsengibacter hankyongi TaxID=2607284 RepID=A0A5J5IF76_9BACT|nr:heavy-metal-associated domain-containing protein [Ginsengibacter hankyongi]KAA9037730.1 heavy-metal-associated domain-containing protein [Ginsengibacter hankyongi]
MNSVILSLIMLAGFTTPSYAQQKAIQKAVIKTPNVQCEACKTRIENHLAHEDGISSVKADWRRHTVTVTWYTDRTNIENIKTELANLGYDADDVTADPYAYKRLPITCQHVTHPAGPKK